MALFDLMKQKQGFESLIDHISNPPLKDAVTEIIEQIDRQINNVLGELLAKFNKPKLEGKTSE